MDIATIIAANPALPMFSISALAASSLVAWGIFKHVKDKNAAEAKGLADDLAKMDELWPNLENLRDALRDDPWAVLSSQRDNCAATLSKLDRLARQYRSPKVWHLVLNGHQYELLNSFLQHISALVLVLRNTNLSIDGPARPYNGDRRMCAKAIYRALGMPLLARGH